MSIDNGQAHTNTVCVEQQEEAKKLKEAREKLKKGK